MKCFYTTPRRWAWSSDCTFSIQKKIRFSVRRRAPQVSISLRKNYAPAIVLRTVLWPHVVIRFREPRNHFRKLWRSSFRDFTTRALSLRRSATRKSAKKKRRRRPAERRGGRPRRRPNPSWTLHRTYYRLRRHRRAGGCVSRFPVNLR